MFKGTIRPGTNVQARFALSRDADGSALVFLGAGAVEGSITDSVAVAPGGSATLSVTPTTRGILRVVVDVSDESDAGRLAVDPVTPEEAIQGDTTWGYVVVE